MPEYSNYVEGRTNADALDGSELVAISQDGAARKTTTQDIADLGGGAVDSVNGQTGVVVLDAEDVGAVASVTGQNNAVDTTDTANPVVRNSVRTVTGADASEIGDNNGLVILNSATPFDFTLDQLAQWTKITFINYGAGEVTFINGSGVTAAGQLTLQGGSGTNLPSIVFIWDTLTTPRGIAGTPIISLESVDTTEGTITLNCQNNPQCMFTGSASISTPKTIALSNDSFTLVINFVLVITDLAAVLTFPSEFTMEAAEGFSRWNDTDHEFTAEVIGKHQFSATWDGTDWCMLVTTPFS